MDIDQSTEVSSSTAAAAAAVTSSNDDKVRRRAKVTIVATTIRNNEDKAMEETFVDVQTINPVPVFDSDSEDETEVFSFETKVKNLILAKLGKVKQSKEPDD